MPDTDVDEPKPRWLGRLLVLLILSGKFLLWVNQTLRVDPLKRRKRRYIGSLIDNLVVCMVCNPEDPSEQRRHRRLSSQIPAKLTFGGGAWMCEICNISPRGAGLEPAIPSAVGHMVEIHSERLAQPLLGRVVNVAENRTNVAFELDSAMQYELAKFLATNLDLN